jgi:chromosome segregation ATPase
LFQPGEAIFAEEAAGQADRIAEDETLSDPASNPITYYVDDIKDSWKNLRFYIFPRPLVSRAADEGDEVSSSAPAELDVLAKANEELRERCINIVNRSEDLLTLRNEFIEVFGEVGKILKNTEGTSASLVQRNAMLTLEEQEHSALKVRYRVLHEENETNRNEKSVLQGEVQRSAELVAGREAHIQKLEAELIAEREKTASLLSAQEQERFIANLATEKLQAALAEIDNDKNLIETLRAEGAALNDRCATSEFHVLALQASLAQINAVAEGLRESLSASEHKVDGLSQRINAAEIEIENFRGRADSAESALSAARLEQDIAQTLSQQRAKENRDEVAALEARIDAESSRADAAEQLLSDVRAELNVRTADLRAKERHVEELEAKIQPLAERAEEARNTIAGLEVKIAEDETSRASLANRAQALVRAMSDTRARLESSEERATLLNKRLADETARFTADSEQREQKIHALTLLLEEEKAARIVMSGALEAARSEVTRLRPVSGMRESLARASEAAAEAREYSWPWSPKDEDLKSLETAPDSPDRAPGAQRSLKPPKGSSEAELSLPRAKPLIVRRDRKRSDARS